jgi:hypothetical protein
MSDATSWDRWAYVAACVFVPALWGAITAWLFARQDRRRAARRAPDADRRPIDYQI